MLKVTHKMLDDVMALNFNKNVSYVGRLLEKNYALSKPIKFVFMEWNKDNKFEKLVFIQESHILKLIKE